jgi:hypothetical protein
MAASRLALSLLSLSLCFAVALSSKRVLNVGLNHRLVPPQPGSYSGLPRGREWARGLSSSSSSSSSTPNNNRMDGNILPVGIYWMSVYIGTPPQHFSAAVDSGSGDLIVPSADCTGCHPENTGEYAPDASTTSQRVPCSQSSIKCYSPCSSSSPNCTFSNTYETCNLTAPQQPCTVSGPLYYDSFTLGGLQGKTVFGAIEYQTSNFQQFFDIDAVIGFIPYASSWNGQSPFQTLVDDGEIANIYAMCMSPNDGGVITLGGVDDTLRSGDFQYTPQVPGFAYEIKLLNLQVGSQLLGVGAFTSKLIIDSGTNVLLQRHQNFVRIQSALIQQMCTPPNVFTGPGVCDNNNDFFDQVCYAYTPAQIAQFPPISLIVDNATLTMAGADYVVENGTSGYFCFGVKDTGDFGLDIIGDVVMQNYYVSFDNVNRVLGWAPVNKDNCMKVKNSLTTPTRTHWKNVVDHIVDRAVGA